MSDTTSITTVKQDETERRRIKETEARRMNKDPTIVSVPHLLLPPRIPTYREARWRARWRWAAAAQRKTSREGSRQRGTCDGRGRREEERGVREGGGVDL